MALSSPRFRNETDLQKVDNNQKAYRSGDRGRVVHLLQMALIDLGIAMPRSTTRESYSPDGIYGSETVEAVKAFQRQPQNSLTDDGVIGQNTLRALDRRHAGYSHRFNLHFRSLALTNVPFDTMMTNIERVYAQYGIHARYASGESLGLSEAEQQRFNVIDQQCNWVMNSGEFNELHQLGSPIPPNDLAVFIVNSFQRVTLRGCGGHASHRPACTAAHDCTRWTIAHEAGHVLLTSRFTPVHFQNEERNLMYKSTNDAWVMPSLTDRQVRKMRTHPVMRTA
jgi:hypothetical protein